MTTYFTKEPLGSTSPYVLFDNAQNLDYALNDITKSIWTDRFGRNRKSYWGMEQAFSAQLLSQQQRFNIFIQSSGYKVIGEYTSGPLTVTDYNQLIRYQNAFWKLTASTSIPFTTTGNDAASWVNDSAHFFNVGDGELRQELASAGGAGMVGGQPKPVTWSGFAGGADPTGVDSSDAAFAAAAMHPEPVTIPDGVYKLTANVSGDFLEGTAVTYTGAGRALPKKIGFWSDQGAVRLHRFPGRVFFGNAVQYDGKYAPVDASFLTKDAGYDWLERSAQMHVCHQEGGAAIVGSSRSSDKAGVTGQTCIGLSAYAWADSGQGSAWGAYIEAVRGVSVTSNIFGVEITAKNLGTDTVITSPYNPFSQGSTIGAWFGAGGDGSLMPAAAGPSSAAIVIGKNAQRWNKGIQFQAAGLVGTDGNGIGKATAIELARGHAIEWRHSALTGDISGGIRSENNSKSQATFGVFTLNGFEIHGYNADQSAEVTLMRILPFTTAVNFIEVRAGAAGGRPNIAIQGTDTNIDLVLTPKGTGSVRPAGNLIPHTTNTLACGTASNSWAGGSTQTAFTVTSDEFQKTPPVPFSDAELDAAEEVAMVQYQYLDRVEAKGPDGARWHFGAIAQRYVEAFERHGLDAHRYGFICYDEWEDQYTQVQTNEGGMVYGVRTTQRLVTVKKTRVVSKPVMTTEWREVLVDEEDGNGTRIKTIKRMEFPVPKLVQIFIFNDDGSPHLDANGNHAFTYEPVMEDVTEEYEEDEQQEFDEAYTEPAAPEYIDVIEIHAGSRYGIRYEEMLVLEAAVQRRKYERLLAKYEGLVARVDVLEGAGHV